MFVLPSLAQGISNTILEAMATGLPVLATAGGGNVELVQAGYSGRLFPARDVACLARMLADYVADPSLRHAHGNAGRRIVMERFTLDAMVSGYQAVYEGVLSSSIASGHAPRSTRV